MAKINDNKKHPWAASTSTCSGQATPLTKETLDLASNERKLLISKKGLLHAEKQPFWDHHAPVRSLSDLKDGLSDARRKGCTTCFQRLRVVDSSLRKEVEGRLDTRNTPLCCGGRIAPVIYRRRPLTIFDDCFSSGRDR